MEDGGLRDSPTSLISGDGTTRVQQRKEAVGNEREREYQAGEEKKKGKKR